MDPADRNRVGIIGAGRLGQAMARIALRAGRSVIIANSRGPASPTSVVSALCWTSAGTVEQASAASIVVIAVPWGRVPVAVQGLEWNGQIVIDATNDFDPSDLDEPQASGRRPRRRCARGQGREHLGAAILGADPHEAGGQRVILSPATTSMRSPQ